MHGGSGSELTLKRRLFVEAYLGSASGNATEAARLTAQQEATLYYPLLLTIARTGLRLGEAVALRWDDVDLTAGEIMIRRTFSGGAVGTPKSGKTRRVDMGTDLVAALRRHDAGRFRRASARTRSATHLPSG